MRVVMMTVVMTMLVVSAGCEDEKTPREKFLGSLAARICKDLSACCSTYGGVSRPDLSSYNECYASTYRGYLQEYTEEHYTIHAEYFDTLLAAQERLSAAEGYCEGAADPALGTELDRLWGQTFVGQVDVGEPCDNVRQCRSELYCDIWFSVPPVCAERHLEGEGCIYQDCVAGLICADDVCTEPMTAGEACVEGSCLADDLHCADDQDTCVEDLPTGSACDRDSECSGGFCSEVDGTCLEMYSIAFLFCADYPQ